MIVLLVLGSAYLGWMAYGQRQTLNTLRANLAQGGLVPKTVAEIQQSAELYTLYKDRGASDALLKGGEDMLSYINQIASHQHVNVGRVDIDPARESDIGKDVSERTYRVTPNDQKATFGRLNIANFLFKLEEDSPRVKVTQIEIKPKDNPKVGERPQDEWQLKLSVSKRSRKATAPPPPAR